MPFAASGINSPGAMPQADWAAFNRGMEARDGALQA
jgi:hypothetical protein